AKLYVRCNYCSSGLWMDYLRRQDNMRSGWLAKQDSVIGACPICHKPLPKCYVCLMGMGALNPHIEMKRHQLKLKGQEGSVMGGGGGGGAGRGPDEEIGSLPSLPMSQWFSWCQR
ncbi:unnamed protein product, partial [Discosporangium mesarthrocarpum]